MILIGQSCHALVSYGVRLSIDNGITVDQWNLVIAWCIDDVAICRVHWGRIAVVVVCRQVVVACGGAAGGIVSHLRGLIGNVVGLIETRGTAGSLLIHGDGAIFLCGAAVATLCHQVQPLVAFGLLTGKGCAAVGGVAGNLPGYSCFAGTIGVLAIAGYGEGRLTSVITRLGGGYGEHIVPIARLARDVVRYCCTRLPLRAVEDGTDCLCA